MVLVLDTCFKEESGEIVMRITSDGGNATYGLAIYEMIRNAPSPVTTYAYGGVASAATMIFMAGKERIITCSSYLLIHEPYIEASAATTVTIAKSEQNTALLKFLYKRFIDVYTGVTKQPRDHIEKLVQNETILSSEEALKLGFATQRIGC
jgi:ATP-dependent protease ClpP protease subunit